MKTVDVSQMGESALKAHPKSEKHKERCANAAKTFTISGFCSSAGSSKSPENKPCEPPQAVAKGQLGLLDLVVRPPPPQAPKADVPSPLTIPGVNGAFGHYVSKMIH